MRILGLDLGSRAGWAIVETHDGLYREITHGFVDLVDGDNSSKRSQSVKKIAKAYGTDQRGYDPRPGKLFKVVKELLETGIDAIAFEDVQFHNSTAQSHLWASLRGCMWAAAGDRPIGWHAIHVGTIKKFATGRGDAKKEHMMNALLNIGLCITDDNEADAIWVGLCAAEIETSGSPEKITRYSK